MENSVEVEGDYAGRWKEQPTRSGLASPEGVLACQLNSLEHW